MKPSEKASDSSWSAGTLGSRPGSSPETRGTILVAGHRGAERQYLGDMLRHAGHRVLEAADGEAARDMARSRRPHLVITGLFLPKLDGLEVIGQLRSHPETAATRIILWTAAFGGPEARCPGGVLGAARLLPKPLEADALLAAVAEILGAPPPPPPPLAALAELAEARRQLLGDPLGRKSLELEEEIGARRQMEVALDDSQRRLGGLIESAMDAIISIDARQRIVLFNGAAEAMFRCPAAKAIGSRVERFIPGHFRAHHAEYVCQFAASGDTSRAMGKLGSIQGLRADGEEFPIEASILKMHIGGQWLLTVILRDITERQKAQAEREESRARLAAVLASLSEGVVVADLAGRVLEMNPAALALHGYGDPREARRQLSEFIDTFELRRLDGQPMPLADWPLARALRGEAFTDFEVEVRRKDRGTAKVISYSGTPVLDPLGKPILGVLTIRDITARQRAEQALRDSEAQLRATFEHAAVGIVYVALPERRFLRVNEAFCRLTGYGEAELLTLTASDLVHPEDRQIGAEAYAEVMAGRLPSFVMEKRYVRKDGRIVWVRTTVSAVQGEGGTARFGINVIEDISDYKAATAEIQRLNADLEQRVRRRTAELERANEALLRSNEELQRFAYIASHDLQTPLRAIAGFSQMLQKEYAGRCLDERADDLLRRVVNGARRMHVLIRDLLTYSRVDAQARPYGPVDFRAVLASVLLILEQSIRDTGAVIDSRELPTVLGDRVQLTQLLQNLVENAIKYRSAAPPRIHVGAERRGDEWIFSVRDNGIGIDRRHQASIFELFRRLHTHHAYPGTGLGLAVCRRVVERHGGRIWVESEPGKGTIFRFTLPARNNDPEAAPQG